MSDTVSKITTYAKAHPYQIAAIALLSGTAIYLILSSGNKQAPQGVVAQGQSESLQLAAMQAGNQLQLAQIQSASAANVIRGQVELKGLEIASANFLGDLSIKAQMAIQSMFADVQKNTTDASKMVSLANIDAQRSVSLADIEAQQHMYDAAVTGGVTTANIQANQAVTLANIAADTTRFIVDLLAPRQTVPPPAPPIITIVSPPPPPPPIIPPAPPPMLPPPPIWSDGGAGGGGGGN